MAPGRVIPAKTVIRLFLYGVVVNVYAIGFGFGVAASGLSLVEGAGGAGVFAAVAGAYGMLGTLLAALHSAIIGVLSDMAEL